MLKLLNIIILGFFFAGCQTFGVSSSLAQVLSQNQIRLTGIDAGKWISENQDSAESRMTVYVCNAAGCPSGTAVSYLIRDSTLAQQDSKAIDKTFADAKVQLELEGAVFIKNYATHIKGYNAFKREYRKYYNNKIMFFSTTIIFTNNTQVVISSASRDAKFARKYRDEFVSKLEIKNSDSIAQ